MAKKRVTPAPVFDEEGNHIKPETVSKEVKTRQRQKPLDHVEFLRLAGIMPLREQKNLIQGLQIQLDGQIDALKATLLKEKEERENTLSDLDKDFGV